MALSSTSGERQMLRAAKNEVFDSAEEALFSSSDADVTD